MKVDELNVVTGPSTLWHPILRTCREEIVEVCRRSDGGYTHSATELVAFAESADEDVIAHIAHKLGDTLMQGGDYWEAIPYIVDNAMPA